MIAMRNSGSAPMASVVLDTVWSVTLPALRPDRKPSSRLNGTNSTSTATASTTELSRAGPTTELTDRWVP